MKKAKVKILASLEISMITKMLKALKMLGIIRICLGNIHPTNIIKH